MSGWKYYRGRDTAAEFKWPRWRVNWREQEHTAWNFAWLLHSEWQDSQKYIFYFYFIKFWLGQELFQIEIVGLNEIYRFSVPSFMYKLSVSFM
jgi:hypothetical protein